MSALSEIISLTISVNAIGIAVASFNIPMVASVNATWTERARIYESIQDVAGDWSSDSPEFLASQAVFGQTPCPNELVIGRFVGQPTLAYQINCVAATVGSTYGINVTGQGVTTTAVQYKALADLTMGARSGNDITITAHGMTNGDGPYRVANSGGALPTGLSANTSYWIHVVDANTIAFSTTKANALSGTVVTLSADGTGTNTVQRSENDVIIAQLVQGLTAVVGANFTTAQTGSAGSQYLTATANAAGDWFSLEVTNVALLSNLQTQTVPATTPATDIANIQLENDDWYGMIYPYGSDLIVKNIASYIESTGDKIYIADLCTSATITTATGNGDTADALKTLGYTRTAVMYHPSPAAMAGAAWLGAVFPIDPGSDNWMYSTLDGVPTVNLTATHRSNLRSKNANSYYAYAGVGSTFQGTMAGGQFIDITRGVDWIENDMQVGLFTMLKKQKTQRVPYTQAGIAMVVNEVRASLKRAGAAGIIDPTTIVIVTPLLANIAPNSVALRQLPGVKWSATLTGAIDSVAITGVVNA